MPTDSRQNRHDFVHPWLKHHQDQQRRAQRENQNRDRRR